MREVVVQKLAEVGLTAEIQIPNEKRSPLRNMVARLRGQGLAGKKALSPVRPL